MVVQHNLTAMNSNRMLGLTGSAQAKSTEKLSSGYKINRAADDAAGLSISEKMRKQIRGLTQASLNAQDGISAVQTAEGALNEVQDMLQRMNELAVKAANGTNSVSDRTAIQNEIDQLTTEIDRVSETTKFNETYLLKGGEGASTTTYSLKAKGNTSAATESSATLGEGVTKLYQEDGTEINSADDLKAYLDADPTAKVYKTYTAGTDGTEAESTDFVEAKKAKVDLYAAGESTPKYQAGDTLSKADADGITSLFTDAGGSTTAAAASDIEADDTKKYVVNALKDADDQDVAAGTTVDADAKLYTTAPTAATHTDAAADTDYTYTPASSGSASTGLYDGDGNEIAASDLENYFEIDDDGNVSIKSGANVYTDEDGNNALADDDIADYVDVESTVTPPALKLNLHVGADSTTNNQIGISIDAMSATTLGVKGLKIDGADDTNARAAIDTIKDALQKVSDQRATLGAVQNRLEHTINNLNNVVENTTAAESQIRDTDMATEMVKFSNNNILAQAGQSMLAQANQSNQGVLSLLG